MEQRTERLRVDRDRKRKYRAKMKEDSSYEAMLARNRIIMRIRRQNEAYREKERERDRIRHQKKRANSDFRDKEKIKERERKRFSRFLKKYAERKSNLLILYKRNYNCLIFRVFDISTFRSSPAVTESDEHRK